MAADNRPSISEELRTELLERFGPLMNGLALRQALGFRTAGAFRQALARDDSSLPVFQIPGRRGWYALTHEVATWLLNHADATHRDKRP